MTELLWFEIQPQGRARWRGVPSWMRRMALADDGQIYIPAAATGEAEQSVWQLAQWDGVQVLMQDDHPYVPLDWVEREYSQCGIAFAHVRQSVQAAAS